MNDSKSTKSKVTVYFQLRATVTAGRRSMATGAGSLDSGPQARVILQQCLSAKLMVQPSTDVEEAKFVHVGVQNNLVDVVKSS